MNLKLWASAGMVAAATVFAQSYEGDAPVAESAPIAEEPVSAPAPVAQEAPAAEPLPASENSAPQASGDLMSKLDVLRGNSYNFVGNELAATTVSDQLSYPYMMAIGQFLYVEPTNNLGYIAFNKGLTFYGGLDNSMGTVGLLTFGVATPSFGIGVDVGVSKSFLTEKPKDGDKQKTTIVNIGDDIGLTFAMPVGAYAFSVKANWLTTADEATTDDVENDLWQLSLAGAFTNSPSASTFGWTVGAQILRNEETMEVKAGNSTKNITSPNSRVEIDPYYNFALQVLANDMARVMVGSNNMLAIQLFDKGDAASDEAFKEHLEFGLQVTPNIWADVAITENWLAFGGLSHNILLFGYENAKDNADTETTLMQMHSSQTRAQLGLRFQWKMLAVEASLENVIYEKTFAAAFNGENLFANMGFFLNF